MTWHTKRNEVPAASGGGSFLPEDYLQRKAERRGLFISMFLFVVVALGVVGAFFVTHRRWNDIKATQVAINAEYAAEAKKIDDLKALEKQKADVIEKAEITSAIKEKVPRSILLAELINRMPEQLTLSDMQIKGKRTVQQTAAPKPAQSNLSNRGQTAPAQAAKGTPPPPPRPVVPKFEFAISMTGLAVADEDIADYVTALNQCPLLGKVDMVSTTEVTIDDVQLRKFNIEAVIKQSADARAIKPLQVPRLASKTPGGVNKKERDPMDPTVPRDDFEDKSNAANAAGKQE
jgi:Tfp pilus assembly protein PilN